MKKEMGLKVDQGPFQIFFCQNFFLVGYLVGSNSLFKTHFFMALPKTQTQFSDYTWYTQPLLTIAFRDYHREGLGFFGVIKLAKVFFQGRNHLVVHLANKFTSYS